MKSAFLALSTMIVTLGSAHFAQAACTEKRDANGNVSRQCVETSPGSANYSNIVVGNGQTGEQIIGDLPGFDLSRLDPALVRIPSIPSAPSVPAKIPQFDLSSFMRMLGF